MRIKTDYLNAKILSHRANLQRYAMLLATQLTELERKSLHKRIAEEHAEVVRVELLREAKAAKPKKGRSPYRPQSSSASRRTAGASGFLNLSQSGERPDGSASRAALRRCLAAELAGVFGTRPRPPDVQGVRSAAGLVGSCARRSLRSPSGSRSAPDVSRYRPAPAGRRRRGRRPPFLIARAWRAPRRTKFRPPRSSTGRGGSRSQG